MSKENYVRMYLNCQRGPRTDVAGAPGHHNKGGGSFTFQTGRPDLRCRSKDPPPAVDYEQWLQSQFRVGPHGQRGRTIITGEKLRRAVRMIRNGYSKVEAGKAIGTDVRKWLALLPPELAA